MTHWENSRLAHTHQSGLWFASGISGFSTKCINMIQNQIARKSEANTEKEMLAKVSLYLKSIAVRTEHKRV